MCHVGVFGGAAEFGSFPATDRPAFSLSACVTPPGLRTALQSLEYGSSSCLQTFSKAVRRCVISHVRVARAGLRCSRWWSCLCSLQAAVRRGFGRMWGQTTETLSRGWKVTLTTDALVSENHNWIRSSKSAILLLDCSGLILYHYTVLVVCASILNHFSPLSIHPVLCL